VAEAVIGALHAAIISQGITSDVEGSMKYSIITQPAHQKTEDKEKLKYILPYFS